MTAPSSAWRDSTFGPKRSAATGPAVAGGRAEAPRGQRPDRGDQHQHARARRRALPGSRRRAGERPAGRAPAPRERPGSRPRSSAIDAPRWLTRAVYQASCPARSPPRSARTIPPADDARQHAASLLAAAARPRPPPIRGRLLVSVPRATVAATPHVFARRRRGVVAARAPAGAYRPSAATTRPVPSRRVRTARIGRRGEPGRVHQLLERRGAGQDRPRDGGLGRAEAGEDRSGIGPDGAPAAERAPVRGAPGRGARPGRGPRAARQRSGTARAWPG